MSLSAGDSAAAASEKTPFMGTAKVPTVPRRGGKKLGRPTHRGGANTSFLALLAAVSAMAAMFAVVTRLPPINPGAPAFSATASLSGGRRALHKPWVMSALPDDRRSEQGAVTYDKFTESANDYPIELVWQRPRRADNAKPKGIVFFAHGCHHQGTDFFPKSTRCPSCVGLPEETKLTAKALKRGYVVVAVSSSGTCWSTQHDAPRVAKALGRVTKMNKDLTDMPVFAFGASSGGAFVAGLPFFTKVDGVVAQISGVGFPRDPRDHQSYFENPSALGEEVRKSVAAALGGIGAGVSTPSSVYPPVVFSHMSKDALVGALVDESREFLTQAGVATKVSELNPLVIDDAFFHRRVVKVVDAEGDVQTGAETSGVTEPVIRVAESAQMVNELKTNGFLDSEGFLKQDPRLSNWRELAGLKRHASLFGDALVPDKSAVAEVLNVAFAAHELSADGFDENVKWLEEQTKTAVPVAEKSDEIAKKTQAAVVTVLEQTVEEEGGGDIGAGVRAVGSDTPLTETTDASHPPGVQP